jgi:acyl-CoA thioesterase-1
MRPVFFFSALVYFIIAIGCGDGNDATVRQEPTVDSTGTTPPAPATKTILFFGNSLTAGYGVEPAEAFPALIQQKIDSMNLSYKVINGGVSGETSAGGNQRIDFVLKQQPVDIFVLELGANDGLRGIPLTETRKNLQAIIDKVKIRYPSVKLVLAGMQMPPNLGTAYTSEFRNLYPALAEKNNMILIPFLLEGVAGETQFNLEDGIHPTPEGHEVVANNVWQSIQKVL